MQKMSRTHGCYIKPIISRRLSINEVLPYFVIFITAFLSILREPALVYVQTVLYILFAVCGNRKWSAVGLIAVVYGSYSAPMDNELRFSGEYPSIHIMKILGPLKGIDVILATLAIFNLKRLNYLLKKMNAANTLIFIGASFFWFLGTVVYQLSHSDSFDVQYALYITRGILFFIVAATSLGALSHSDLSKTINYAIFACLILMLLSHLFPPQNVLSRELFGVKLNVVFAGDEYASIGILIAALLVLHPKNEFKKAYLICFFALSLALLAGRKAAIVYCSLNFLLQSFCLL